MSGKHSILLTFVVVLLMACISAGAAAESFTAYAGSSKLANCSCSILSDTITIRNTGTSPSSYIISADGEASAFASYVPYSFSLAAGQTIDVRSYIKVPCSTKGTLDLRTIITTGYGLKKAIDQEITLKNCPNIQVAVLNYSLSDCPCSPVKYVFYVKNTGMYEDTYSFSVEPYAEYATLSQKSISIKPGQTAAVYVYMNLPCSLYGDYGFNFITETSRSSFIAKTPFVLQVRACYDYDVSFYENYNICGRVAGSIPITIKNTADISNNYYFDLVAPEWASLANDSLHLSPKQEGLLTILLNPGFGADESYNFTLLAVTERGEVNKTASFTVKVDDCYKASVRVESSRQKICCNITENYDIYIKNEGKQRENFNLSIVAPDWVYLSRGDINLAPSEELKVKMSLKSGCNENITGKYSMTVYAAHTSHPELVESYTTDLEVVSMPECYNVNINEKQVKVYANDTKAITVENTGIYPATYSVAVDAPAWLSVDKLFISINPGESANLTFTATPDEAAAAGKYLVTLKLVPSAYDTTYIFPLIVTYAKENIFTLYWYYFVAALFILILLIFFIILLIRKIKAMPKKEKPKTAKKIEAVKPAKIIKEERTASRKILLPVIIAIMVIAAVLCVFYYKPYLALLAGNATSNESLPITTTLPEQVVSEENVTANVTEEPEESFTYQTFYKNTEKVIDLNKFYYDPDEDMLNFTSTTPEHITVTIENGIAVLMPELDWTGTAYVTFMADDGKGGIVSSPEITLVVKDIPFWIVAKSYISYAVLGIILLALLILFSGIVEKKSKRRSKAKRRKKRK